MIPGPDFPTGGSILGRAGIRAAYATGRGSIIMRAKVAVEELRKDREALIVSEIPYQVNKATLIERIAELVREKRVEGISDLRDESDRDGMRIVIEIKRDAVADVVLNQLWRFTALQSSFGANMIALNGGRPEMLTLTDMLRAFLDFREEVVTRRTKYLLTKARDNAHIQVGLAIAVANIDEVIRLIRTSPDSATARTALMERVWPARDMAPLITLIADPRHALDADGAIRLSEAQARAILELRLARLTALGRDEIAEALNRLSVEIADYLDILSSRVRLMGIIRDELVKVKTDFATPRRTVILDSDADMEDEDLIQREDMVVLVSHGGYIKRAPLSTYRAQRRGGKGRGAMATRDEDFVAQAVRRLDPSAGAVLLVGGPGLQGEGLAPAARRAAGARQGARQPAAARAGRAHHHHHAAAGGRGELGGARRDVRHHARHGPAQQAQRLRAGEPRRQDRHAARRRRADRRRPDLLRQGRRAADHRARPVHPLFRRRRARVQGPRFDGRARHRARRGRQRHLARDPEIDSTRPPTSASPISSSAGRPRARRTKPKAPPRAKTRTAPKPNGASALEPERFEAMRAAEQVILTISENGYGKRTSSFEYRVTGRGGKGIVAMAVNARNGTLVASFPVEESDELMLVTDGGQLIRVPVTGIRIAGRSTQGVIVFDTADEEHVVSVDRIGETGGEAGGDEEEAERSASLDAVCLGGRI